jgi:hypothetical protein
MFPNSTRWWLVSVVLALLSVTACKTYTSIADINRDPARFANQEITISGQASDSFGAMGNGIFQIDDGSGRIWVVSQNFGIPGNGAKVAVTGRVQQGISFGGRTFGTVLMQTQARN